MVIMRTLIIFTLSMFISGCVGTTLTVRTQPSGAILTVKGSNERYYSPATINYNWDQKYVRNNCLQVKGFNATWASGVTASSNEIIQLCNGQRDYYITIHRPLNQRGLDIDMTQETQRQQLQYQKKQASDSRRALEASREASREAAEALEAAEEAVEQTRRAKKCRDYGIYCN